MQRPNHNEGDHLQPEEELSDAEAAEHLKKSKSISEKLHSAPSLLSEALKFKVPAKLKNQLMSKFKKVLRPEKKEKKYSRLPATREEALEHLDGDEEKTRPWAGSPSEPLPNGGMFFRDIDHKSMARIEEDESAGMRAKGTDTEFKIFADHQLWLGRHSFWIFGFLSGYVLVTWSLSFLFDTFIPRSIKRKKRGAYY